MRERTLDIAAELGDMCSTMGVSDKLLVDKNGESAGEGITFNDEDEFFATVAVGKGLDEFVEIGDPMLSAQEDVVIAMRLEQDLGRASGGRTDTPDGPTRVIDDKKVGSVTIG